MRQCNRQLKHSETLVRPTRTVRWMPQRGQCSAWIVLPFMLPSMRSRARINHTEHPRDTHAMPAWCPELKTKTATAAPTP